MAALKLREGAATRVTLRQSTPFQTQKVQSKKQNSNGVEIAWGLVDLLDVPLT